MDILCLIWATDFFSLWFESLIQSSSFCGTGIDMFEEKEERDRMQMRSNTFVIRLILGSFKANSSTFATFIIALTMASWTSCGQFGLLYTSFGPLSDEVVSKMREASLVSLHGGLYLLMARF
jgi:hypothetical protein